MMSRGQAAAGLLLALAAAVPAAAEETGRADRDVPSIVVEGQASRQVPPDTAIVTLGVTTDRTSAQEASRANAASVGALIDAMKAGGIAPADVATTQATLAPIFDTSKNGDPARLKGYRAVNTVTITVRKLDSASALVGDLIDRGANALEGVEFTVADPEPVRDALRGEAIKNAKHRAQIYAEAIGVKLGRVLAIRPESALVDMPPQPKRMAALAAAPVPLEPGLQTLEAHVTVTWALQEQP